MAVDANQLRRVAEIVLQAPSLADATRAVREALPQLRVTQLDALDMRGEIPALKIGRCRLYFMGSDGHCWSVSQDPAAALGLVLTDDAD